MTGGDNADNLQVLNVYSDRNQPELPRTGVYYPPTAQSDPHESSNVNTENKASRRKAEEKASQRKAKNKIAARKLREKKERFVNNLQNENDTLREENSLFKQTIGELKKENKSLSATLEAAKTKVKKAEKNCQRIKATNTAKIAKLAISCEQMARNLATIKAAVTPATQK